MLLRFLISSSCFVLPFAFAFLLSVFVSTFAILSPRHLYLGHYFGYAKLQVSGFISYDFRDVGFGNAPSAHHNSVSVLSFSCILICFAAMIYICP